MTKIDPLSRRFYMTQKAFWADPHNKKMAEFGNALFKQRRTLTSIPLNNSHDYFQRTDGFVERRTKHSIFTRLFTDYEDEFTADMNNEYAEIINAMTSLSHNLIRK